MDKIDSLIQWQIKLFQESYTLYLQQHGIEAQDVNNCYNVICKNLKKPAFLSNPPTADKFKMPLEKQTHLLADVLIALGLALPKDELGVNLAVQEKVSHLIPLDIIKLENGFKSHCNYGLPQSDHPDQKDIPNIIVVGGFEDDFTFLITNGFHEAGHAFFNLGLPKNLYSSLPSNSPPLFFNKRIISESQAYIFEYLARSENFWAFVQKKLGKKYPEIMLASPQEFALHLFSHQSQGRTADYECLARTCKLIEVKKALLDNQITADNAVEKLYKPLEPFHKNIPVNSEDKKTQIKQFLLKELQHPKTEIYILARAAALQMKCSKQALPCILSTQKGYAKSLVRFTQGNVSSLDAFAKYNDALLLITGEKLNPHYLKNYLNDPLSSLKNPSKANTCFKNKPPILDRIFSKIRIR